jgi:Uma2 family endonuclease
MSMQTEPEPPLQTPRCRPPLHPGAGSEPLPEERGAEVDWSDWYLSWEDDVGQSPEQRDVLAKFDSSLGVLAEEQGWERVRIGVDEFFAWMQQESQVQVSPDLFLLDDPPPPPLPGRWETWQPGVNPPRFALEVVSDDWRKDYLDNPRKYDLLGTAELVLSDPEAARGEARSPRRSALEVHRRQDDGSFRPVYHGPGPVQSQELGVWLVVGCEDDRFWLRLARDPEGPELIPTLEEAQARERVARAEAERRQAEAEHQAAEAERREAEERAAREEAERRQAEERGAREELERKLAEALAALERAKQ